PSLMAAFVEPAEEVGGELAAFDDLLGGELRHLSGVEAVEAGGVRRRRDLMVERVENEGVVGHPWQVLGPFFARERLEDGRHEVKERSEKGRDLLLELRPEPGFVEPFATLDDVEVYGHHPFEQ